MRRELVLIALGGNALIRPGESGTSSEQRANLRGAMETVARLSRTHSLILTHGNGPQVGQLLAAAESGALPAQSLDVLVAMTQGQIGYLMESQLRSALAGLGGPSQAPVLSLLTLVEISEADPALSRPEKPVGPVLSADAAASADYAQAKTPKGFRRVVPSPAPVRILQAELIRELLTQGVLVICCGGGGVPVLRKQGRLEGFEAVIDKDRASALLAAEAGAARLVMATDVPGAALDFGGPQQRFLRRLGVDEAQRHLEAGHFLPGSMGPKVEAGIRFARETEGTAVICALEELEEAVSGQAGTWICPSNPGVSS